LSAIIQEGVSNRAYDHEPDRWISIGKADSFHSSA
jgi:hypothetical protein